MVFGETYCQVTHLPIEDGEEVIIIPLGWQMYGEFSKWGRPDANHFMHPYCFIDQAYEAVFNGNPSDLTYLDDMGEKKDYELYMIVKKEVYYDILKKYKKRRPKYVKELQSHKSYDPIYRKTQAHEALELRFKTSHEVLEMGFKVEAPQWMIDIWLFSRFIDYMGIMPTPAWSVDQVYHGEVYEQIREKAKNGK